MDEEDQRYREKNLDLKHKQKEQKGKEKEMNPAVMAAKLTWENWKAKQGRKDVTERGWMKNIK